MQSHPPKSQITSLKTLQTKLVVWGGGRLIYTEHREEGWSLEAGPLTLNNERRDGLWGQAHLHWTMNGRAVFADRPTYTEQWTEGRSSETGPLTLNNKRSGALWRRAHLQLHWTIIGEEVFRRQYHLHQTMNRINCHHIRGQSLMRAVFHPGLTALLTVVFY